MPSILLDHHIDEVAMRSTPVTTAHRWSRRRKPATVASVVAHAVHVAPAPYLSHREDRDRILMFGDIDEAFDGPVDMPPGWQPARGADQLDHDAVRTTIAEMAADTRPVPPTAPRGARPLPGRDTIEYLTAVSVAIQADHDLHMDTLRVINEIASAVAAAPFVRHEPALRMALAPVEQLLAEVDAR